ncbi:MAG TPA: hypothetical protein PK684_01115 [Bacillota bacterium]|nr:hypothetical protein [Bacillota bacterium]
MAYTASRTTNGFELIGNLLNVTDNGREYELTPNTAFSKGDMVVLTGGKVAKAAANAANVLGVMAESITAADNPTAGITYGKVYDNPFNIYRCSFADQTDSTATGGTTTTLIDSGLATSNDDYWNGALLYVYAGTNAGCIRTVTDYVGGTDTLHFQAMPAACDTTTKYIILGAAAAASDSINVGSVGVNLKDENTIDANATIANEAGPLAVLGINPANLTMDVVVRKHRFNGI